MTAYTFPGLNVDHVAADPTGCPICQSEMKVGQQMVENSGMKRTVRYECRASASHQWVATTILAAVR